MPVAPAQPFALWLLPAPGALGALDAYMDALGQRLGVPPYPPHVTVYAGVADDLDASRRRLAALPAPGGPLELPVLGLGGEAQWSRALYLRLAPVEALVALSDAARAQLGGGRPYDLEPHLSLTYRADLTVPERAELAAVRPPLPTAVRVDRLALVAPGPEGWPAIAAWRRIDERPL